MSDTTADPYYPVHARSPVAKVPRLTPSGACAAPQGSHVHFFGYEDAPLDRRVRAGQPEELWVCGCGEKRWWPGEPRP